MKVQPKQPQPAELQAIHQLFQAGQVPLAEIRAQALAAAYPKSLPALNLLGMCQQAQGKLRDAAASFRKMIALDPNIAEIHFNLGAIYTQLNDAKGAMAAYRKALQIKPDLTVAHFNLARCCNSKASGKRRPSITGGRWNNSPATIRPGPIGALYCKPSAI